MPTLWHGGKYAPCCSVGGILSSAVPAVHQSSSTQDAYATIMTATGSAISSFLPFPSIVYKTPGFRELPSSSLPAYSRCAGCRRAGYPPVQPIQGSDWYGNGPSRAAVPGTRRHEYDRCRVNLQKLAKSDIRAMKCPSGARKRFACTNLSDKKNNPKLGLRGPPPDQLPPPPEARARDSQ